MRRFCLFLLLLLSLGELRAHKPADTLSSGRWEFVQNLGQWNSAVTFSARMNGGALFFENNSFVVTQLHPQQLQDFHEAKHSGKPYPKQHFDAASYRVSFLNPNPDAVVEGGKPYNHYYNYFLGKDPKHWASMVHAYNTLSYHQLYNHIDLLFLADYDYLKYEFHIAPGGDPKQIKIQYDGLESIAEVGEELLLHTAVDRVLELAPFAYQMNDKGDTIPVPCKYRLQKNILSFDLGNYDSSLPLVIDPIVVFSSYSGSTADNWGYTATYDSHGNLYGGGIVFDVGYPTTLGAFQIDFAGQVDVSISKFDASGSFLHYSTYLGGSAADIPHSLHVNDNDELYIFGTTGSADFPVTADAFDTSFNGGPNITLSTSMTFPAGSDIFVSKLSADGTQLHASTFIGGSGNDGLNTAAGLRKNYADDNRGEIIVDESSNVYVVSSTSSSDFPVTANCHQPNSSGSQEVCVFKFSQDLSSLIWCTYFGGSSNDAGYSMYVAADKSVYLCGGTTSGDLPVTPNVYQTTHADNGASADGFVAHLSSNGSLLLQNTYLGKSGYDQAYLIKGDDEDFPHVLGQTDASGTQWVHNVAYHVPGGGQFLTKLSKNLGSAVWSTALGSGNGGPDISPTAMLVDYCNNIYLSGWGSRQLNGFGGTNGLPVTDDAFQSTTDGSDFYFMAISDDASNLIYATYFGGAAGSAREHVDGGTSRFDKHGKIYQAVCAGCGGQSSFPTTPGAYSNVNGSNNCNLGVIKIDFSLPVVVADFLMPNVVCLPDTVFFTNYSQTISSQTDISWNFGDGSISSQWEPYHVYTQTGYYEVTLIVHDLGSCNVADTLRKRILVLSNTQSTLPTVNICAGEYAELGVPPSIGVDYLWSPTETLSNPAISNPIATPDQSSLYTLIASTAACVDTISQQVDVHDVSAFISGDSIICIGESSTLTANITTSDNYIVEWSEYIDFQSVFSTDATSVTVTPATSRTYYARVTTDYCVKIIPFHITVFNVEITDYQDYLLCFENEVTLHVQCIGGVPPYQYQWQLGDGETSIDPNPVVMPQHTTNYTITIMDANGCTATAVGQIKVREGTFPDSLQAWSSVSEILAYHEATLFSTDYGDEYTYQWTPAQHLETPYQPTTIVVPEETTTYTVIVTDTFGCSLTDTVTIKVLPVSCDMPFVFIPNSFTPNGDGVNDIFYVRSDILVECYFVVYNRWGERIFETYDQHIGWNGMFKQKECQTGTYDYYFKGKCMDGDELELKGNVTLIR
ncbi:MAG: gliding motility-associated C-terminal domain-containing protein [Bacteroidales bacterium]|nr:gliding motility-associated C-terminal domain-containing protein [Bacteroidales bacterium]